MSEAQPKRGGSGGRSAPGRMVDLGSLPDFGGSAAAAVRDRAASVLRPTGALARLDDIAVWLAGWQRTTRPAVERPAVLLFAGDHGVVEEGVSAYPADVTRAMLKALQEDVATANAFARSAGATLDVIDAGVGDPTANFVHSPALTPERFASCFEVGRQAVRDVDADLLVFGEMGIGNTTSASAVTALVLGCSPAECVGRGTGIDDEAFRRKLRVVEAAKERVGDVAPLEALRQVGGTELVAIAGAVLEARLRSIPVVLDGFVVCASVAPLEATHSGALDHCVAGHRSPEPGHGLLLSRLGKQPLLDLEMRLGEGTGALAAIPLIRAAAAGVCEVATFDEWGIERE